MKELININNMCLIAFKFNKTTDDGPILCSKGDFMSELINKLKTNHDHTI